MRGAGRKRWTIVIGVLGALAMPAAVAFAADPVRPVVSITSPAPNAKYYPRQPVTVDYSCSESNGGPGIAACTGDLPVGAPVDTTFFGAHTFTVTARDKAGNTTTATVTYAVDTTPIPLPGPECDEVPATIIVKPGQGLVRGTQKRDVILGSAGPDRIDGRGGRDLICGGAGNDKIVGGTGGDKVFGQGGNDHVSGGPGNDRVDGGTGKDRVDVVGQAAGRDLLFGGPGGDLIRAVDGRHDRISCGAGRDKLFADSFDLRAGCDILHLVHPRPVPIG